MDRRSAVKQVADIRRQRFEAYEHAQAHKRDNETTDAAERISMAMSHEFSYQRAADGRLFTVDAAAPETPIFLDTIFQNGIKVAERLAAADPKNWFVEYNRRLLDYDELLAQQQLRHGEKLVVFSPIPDVVRNGTANVDAYDRTRMKMLVRIAERQGQQVAIRSFSLDGSDYTAMQCAAQSFGGELPSGLSSEEVLAHRFRLPAEHDYSAADTEAFIREAYDLSLERQFGGKYYAGRKNGFANQGDALGFIKKQPDLVAAHMQKVEAAEKRFSGDQLNTILGNLRYDFTAALERRLKGVEISAGDMSAAGNEDRAKGIQYNGDCATGTSNTTVESQLDALGYGNRQEKMGDGCSKCRSGMVHTHPCVNCPFCRNEVTAKITKNTIVCDTGCKVEVNRKTGEILKRKVQQGLGFFAIIDMAINEWMKERRLRGRQKYDLAA